MEVMRVWILMFLMISPLHADHGSHCIDTVDNTVAILHNKFIHLFPKNYRVQLRVDLTDLNKPSLCIWTALSLLKGDWLAVHQQLWQDQENFRKTKWLIKGLEDLNVTDFLGLGTGKAGLEAWCGKKAVALLVNVTLKALHIVRKSNCAPCGTSAPHSLAAQSPTVTPTNPWVPEQVAEYGSKLEKVAHSVNPTFASKSRCDREFMRILKKSLKQVDYPMSQHTLTQLCQSSAERMNQRMMLAESSRRTDKETASISLGEAVHVRREGNLPHSNFSPMFMASHLVEVTPSPKQHDPSPHHSDSSPQQHDPSPHHSDSSPQQHDPSPHHSDSSPQQHDPSPHHTDPSAQLHDLSPQQHDPSPQQHDPSAHLCDHSPQQHDPSPHHADPSAQICDPSPQQHDPSPHHTDP